MSKNNLGGRPTDYNPQYCQQVEKLAEIGLPFKEMAYFFGVCEKSFHTWKNKYPDFKASLKKGLEANKIYQEKKIKENKRRNDYKKEDHVRLYNNNYVKSRLKSDIKYKIKHHFSSFMRSRIKDGKKESKFKILGYSVQELMLHLEQQFVEGMTWENHGSVWHIDHIIPDSYFEYTTRNCEEFKRSWALDNLQPLFASDNLSKGNRYIG